MRRLLPPLIVTLFALFAAQPLAADRLTCSDDNSFALTRAVSLEQLIRDGHPFSRWSPYMAHGYGFPFFNYYGALSSYILVLIHALGLTYPVALHIMFGLCLWLAGLATYAFVREWWSEAAGVAAAVVYLTAPYFAFDILFRAALAETLALVWIPLILFTLHRALKEDRRPVLSEVEGLKTPAWKLGGFGFAHHRFGIWDLPAAISFAALMYTHNTTSLASAPLIAGYVAFMALRRRDWRKLIRGGLVLALGLALAARFWLPALAETGLVQTDRLLVPPIFTYYTNYLTPIELFAPPVAIDSRLINPSPAKALGLIAASLALLGFAALAHRAWHMAYRRKTGGAVPDAISHWDLAFGIWALGFGILFSALTLPFTRPIWDNVPLMKFIQFPWRFLGPASLCAAVLAGAAAHWLLKRHQWLIAAAVTLIAALGHLSWWYPRYCSPFTEVSFATSLQYEYDTFTLGTTAKGEYLPKTVQYLPEDNSIAQALIRGEQPKYLAGLPADSALTLLNPDPLNYRATLTLSSPTQLTFNQFYFPGWTAAIDNQPATIQLTPNTGLITVLLPAGQHTVSFHFGATPVRTFGEIISLLALLLIATSLWRIAHSNYESRSTLHVSRFELHRSRFTVLVCLIPLSLLLLRPLLIDRTANFLHHSPFDGQTLSLGQPLNLTLSSGLTVLSTDFPTDIASNSQFDVILYASARDPIAANYRPRFDIVSADGLQWGDGNTALPPRWHREPLETTAWPGGQYAQWARRLTVLPGTPPGDYQLTATIFDRATLAPDSVVDSNGNFTSPLVQLGAVHVTRPITPPALADLNIEYPVDYDFGPLTLLGYNLDRVEARPGDSVLITFFFHADESARSNLKFNLLDPSYPTSQWQPGDLWRFQTFARLPMDAASGPYQFNLQLNGSSFALRPIQLTAPDRVFIAPPMDYATRIRFDGAIELSGYTITATAESTQIDLLWHALATPESELSAFIHIEDTAGNIVAQSDAVPANWSRPTTGWLGGEYILDSHTLPSLPMGEYMIRVGLADRLTGQRLSASDDSRPIIGVYKAP